MALKLTIKAKQTTAPLDGYINFAFQLTNSGVTINRTIQFETTSSNFDVGVVRYDYANTDLFAQEIQSYFNYLFSLNNIIYTTDIIGDTVTYILGTNSTVDSIYFIFFKKNSVSSNLWSLISEAYTFPPEPVLTTRNDEVILSRSPWFFKESPTIIYDQMKFDIYVYRGEKTIDKPTIRTFPASKFVVQVGQPTISIDIHKLVNDFVQNEYLESTVTGVVTTSQKDSVWIFIDAGIYLDGVLKYSINQNLLALDGFGYHKELANPDLTKKVLSTIDKHIIYNNSKYFLYFLSTGLTSITINGVTVPFTLNPNFNNQFIAGVDVMQYASTSTNFNAVFVYGAETITHNVQVKTECRNSLINVTFKNKYGFYQKIPFAKLSKKTIDIESEDYMPFVSNFGSYDLNKHNKRSYLTNGKEKIVCNTDFMPESYNDLFKELMLSEQIYIEENNEFLPVNITKKSFNYKTVLNDKLIQYSFEFDYSYNEINNVL